MWPPVVSPRHLLLATLIAFSAPAWGQSGYIHGPDHCFRFTAPSGWVLDNRSGAQDGLAMVLYPVGSSWSNAKDVIYARAASFKPAAGDAEQKIKGQVADVLGMYRQGTPSITLTARKVQDLKSSAGQAGELWRFTGHPNGGEEQVAYFVGPQTVNFFVMQISKSETTPPGAAKLVELASSYREAKDCVPCERIGSCTSKK